MHWDTYRSHPHIMNKNNHSNQRAEAEFTQLVHDEKSTIYSVCLMFSDEHTEVDDLVQECLINLWEGFRSFQGRSNARTWLYRICMNTCISFDRKRKHTTDPTIVLDDRALFLNNDGAVAQKQYRMLHDRISKLGPFDRAIILLWLEDMPYEDIAAIVGISVKNVSVRLVRIKEQLISMGRQAQ